MSRLLSISSPISGEPDGVYERRRSKILQLIKLTSTVVGSEKCTKEAVISGTVMCKVQVTAK